MNPDQRLIASLSLAAKKELILLQRELVTKATDQYRTRVLRTLFMKGMVVYDEETDTFSIVHKWISFQISDREKILANVVVDEEKEPIPDPPKRLVRPPAQYSNTSREDYINHILNNY